MTPFGRMLRDMRRRKGVTQKEMAAAIGVSAAYLSALEHGHRGMPSWPLLQKIIGYFNVIWDEADAVLQVAARSHPKVTIDTAGLSPAATELANLLAVTIDSLAEDEIEDIIAALRTARRG